MTATIHGCLAAALVLITTQLAIAQDAKPKWLDDAEKALLGTWENTNTKTNSIPRIEILVEEDTLKIRIWGRTLPKDSPYGPPDKLNVLSPRADIEVATKDTAVAFATHTADFAIKHFTLRLRDDVIHLEGITIFTDESGRSNRIYNATFKKP